MAPVVINIRFLFSSLAIDARHSPAPPVVPVFPPSMYGTSIPYFLAFLWIVLLNVNFPSVVVHSLVVIIFLNSSFFNASLKIISKSSTLE